MLQLLPHCHLEMSHFPVSWHIGNHPGEIPPTVLPQSASCAQEGEHCLALGIGHLRSIGSGRRVRFSGTILVSRVQPIWPGHPEWHGPVLSITPIWHHIIWLIHERSRSVNSRKKTLFMKHLGLRYECWIWLNIQLRIRSQIWYLSNRRDKWCRNPKCGEWWNSLSWWASRSLRWQGYGLRGSLPHHPVSFFDRRAV